MGGGRVDREAGQEAIMVGQRGQEHLAGSSMSSGM